MVAISARVWGGSDSGMEGKNLSNSRYGEVPAYTAPLISALCHISKRSLTPIFSRNSLAYLVESVPPFNPHATTAIDDVPDRLHENMPVMLLTCKDLDRETRQLWGAQRIRVCRENLRHQ